MAHRSVGHPGETSPVLQKVHWLRLDGPHLRAMTLKAWRWLCVPPPNDGVQLAGQLGDEMLPVPGDLGFGENLLLHLARQMRPGADHRRSQPAHQAFFLGGIAKLFVFHERHVRALSQMVEGWDRGWKRELRPRRT